MLRSVHVQPRRASDSAQVQNSFDALKEAWGQRKREVEARARAMGGAGLFAGGGGYGGYYGGAQQEAARLEQLAKQAESNFGASAHNHLSVA